MKTIISLAVAIGLPALAWAEDQTPVATAAGEPNVPVIAVEGQPSKISKPDRFVMSSGSVAAVRGAQTERLTNDVKLLNGTILTPGGTVRWPDGSEVHLADGQTISVQGKVGPVPAAAASADNPPAAKAQ